DELPGLLQADLRLRDLHRLHDLPDGEHLDLARLVVETAAQVLVVLVVLLGRGQDRVLDGGDDDVGVDVLLPADLLDLLPQLVRHMSPAYLNSTSRRPWETFARGTRAVAPFSFSSTSVTAPSSTDCRR